MEGILTMSTGMFSTSQTRYAVLHDDVLTICQHKRGKPLAKIHLGVSSVEVDEKNLSFTVNTGLSSATFNTRSMEELIKWTTLMHENKQEYLHEKNYREAMNRVMETENSDLGYTPSDAKFLLKEDRNRNAGQNVINQRMSMVWCTQAKLGEALNSLFVKIPREYKFVEASEEIERLGNELKRHLTLCLNEILREKDKLAKLSEMVARQTADLKGSVSRSKHSAMSQRQLPSEDNEFNDDFGIQVQAQPERSFLRQKKSKRARARGDPSFQLPNMNFRTEASFDLDTRAGRILREEDSMYASERDDHVVLETIDSNILPFQKRVSRPQNGNNSIMDGTLYETVIENDLNSSRSFMRNGGSNHSGIQGGAVGLNKSLTNNLLNTSLSQISKTKRQQIEENSGSILGQDNFQGHFKKADRSIHMRVEDSPLDLQENSVLQLNLHPYIKTILEGTVFQQFPVVETPTIRTVMPFMIDPDEKFSFMQIAKEAVGKNITKITMPASLNEPLSALQKMAELFEYRDILEIADRCTDPLLRVGYCLSFVMIQYGNFKDSTKKPFNPLLGETYELEMPDCRILLEQVSHHPPIGALHASSSRYEVFGDNDSDSSLSLNSLSIKPKGTIIIHLKTSGDRIEVKKCPSEIRNIMYMTTYIQHFGTMTATNLKTGVQAELILDDNSGMFSSEANTLCHGQIKNSKGEPFYSLEGNWDSKLTAKNLEIDEEYVLVEAISKPTDNYREQFSFTKFAVNLNHLTNDLAKTICPTDCRFRPDQRALEMGDRELAQDEKTRLEDAQRARRKLRTERKEEWKPVWFREVKDAQGENSTYEPVGAYWEKRRLKDWDDVTDIYN